MAGFKAYQPPQEEPNNDWTDTLTTKVMPIAGAVIGGVYGGPAGATAGYGIGSAAGGLINPKKGSELQTAAGVKTGLQGWQNYNTEQMRKPQGEIQTGSGMPGTPSVLNQEGFAKAPDQIESFYAKRMQDPNDELDRQFGSNLSSKYNVGKPRF